MLEGAEAHHLLHVMRAAVGEIVTLFDDSGAEFVAVVESLRRSHADLRILNVTRSTANCLFRSWLASRCPKAIAKNGSWKN